MIVSCEASKISKKKVPKRVFRARLPQNFTKEGSKTSVSREASSKFHRTMLPKHNRSHAQDNARSNSKSSKFAFRHSFVQSTKRILREGSSSKIKMCVSLQLRAIRNFKMHVSLQRRAQKCMNLARDVRGNPRHAKNHTFTTVSDFRPARSDERVAPSSSKFAFHHSFGRPMRTKRRKGRARTQRICISPQFWTSDEHEVTRGLRDVKICISRLGRPTRSDERVASAT